MTIASRRTKLLLAALAALPLAGCAGDEVSRTFGIPVVAIATLDDMLATLRGRADLRGQVPAIEEYRRRFGGATQADCL